MRREIRGNRSSAEVSTTTAVTVKPGVSELRFETGSAGLMISGEDRTDVLCELKVWSSGYDETEAKKYANETLLKSTEAGMSLVFSIKYPDPATQRASLVVRMPKAMSSGSSRAVPNSRYPVPLRSNSSKHAARPTSRE